MVKAAQNLEKGGADFVMICTNTMHKMAKEVQDSINIPLFYIVDPTGEAIKAAGVTKIGLLGTKFAMEHDFYKGRLNSELGLEVVVPNDTDRQIIHDIIYDELCLGIIREDSKKQYQEIIKKLKLEGAQGVILGCTEIMLLINQTDTDLPIFDTTRIHAEAAVERAVR